ncbi:MAG: cysteine--tRNA ligase, partial [Bdellovibrionota bacterium]
IIKNGKGYVVGGEVYFQIEAFPGYGKLSHKQIDDLVAGARVDISEKKKNPLDFSLWKPAKPGEPYWDSPWGKGRPGWHIECSAMAGKWLGDQIDLHHGGEDLIFPHHENEIAQSEAASGREPFVNYWLHHAFVTLSKEKMSKSVGNVFLAKDFLGQFSGEIARFLLLSTHYRSPIDLGDEIIETALTSLQRLYEAKAKALEVSKLHRLLPDMRAEGAWGSFVADCEKAKLAIGAAFANDFNSAEALASLFSLIREFNRTLSEPRAAATPSAVIGAQQLIQVIEMEMGAVLGVGLLDPSKGLGDIQRVRASRISASGAAKPTEQEIKDLIQQRLDARKSKDFVKADQIRKDLVARGVVLKDSPSGTTWEYQ